MAADFLPCARHNPGTERLLEAIDRAARPGGQLGYEEGEIGGLRPGRRRCSPVIKYAVAGCRQRRGIEGTIFLAGGFHE